MTKEEIDEELKRRFALKAAGKCPVCERDVSKYGAEMFKDDRSRAQFKLYGCCQPCQDILFGDKL